MEERTCQEWLDGKYGLYSSDNYFSNENGENVIIPEDMPEVYKREIRKNNVIWEEKNRKNLVHDHELLPEVLACINTEKEKIFNVWKQKKTDELIADYLSTNKDDKYQLDEVHDVKVILGIREKELLDDLESGVLLNRSRLELVDLREIREYYLTVLKPNKPAQVGFINSPHFPFQNRSKVPYQIMASAFYEYLNWLEGRRKKPKIDNRYRNPVIAIAVFLEGEDLSAVAEEWVGKYGLSKNPRSILNDRIHQERDLIVSTIKKKETMLRNLSEARELLLLRNNSLAIIKLDKILLNYK